MKQEGFLDTIDMLDGRQFLLAVKKLADARPDRNAGAPAPENWEQEVSPARSSARD